MYNKRVSEGSGVDISRDGYKWKDDAGINAAKDPMLANAGTILKNKDPQLFKALVDDQDSDNLADSDLVRGIAGKEANTNLPDNSVNVKVNGQRVAYVDVDKQQVVKEAIHQLDIINKSLNKLI